MILSFKVSNFKSFDEEQELSFVVQKRTSVSELEQNYSEVYGQKILKSIVLFGANASGKSNLIKALDWFRSFVILSFKASNENSGIDFDEFLLNRANQDKPARFELDFILGEKDHYLYSFAVNKKVVEEEKLIKKLKTKNITKVIFSRTLNKVELKSKNKAREVAKSIKTREAAKNILKPNVLFLSVLASSNDKLANNILQKIQKILIINSKKALDDVTGYTLKEYPNYKSSVDKLVLESDFGIQGLKMEHETMSQEQIAEILSNKEVNLPSEIVKSLLEKKGQLSKRLILTTHKGLSENGQEIDVDFGLEKESDGTQRLFNLAGPIANTLEEGRTLIVDELDAHLHTELCKFILLQFHQNNPNNSQLIFTSHSVSLMDSDFLRRDQIWFAEKTRLGATELYSLASLSERQNLDYAKRYLEGRYGAVPYISSLEKYKDQYV